MLWKSSPRCPAAMPLLASSFLVPSKIFAEIASALLTHIPPWGLAMGAWGRPSSSFARGNRCRKKDDVPPEWLEERQLVLKAASLAPASQRLFSAPECRCGAETGIPPAEGLGLWAPSFWPHWVSIKCDLSFLDLEFSIWDCSFPLEVALGYFSYFW